MNKEKNSNEKVWTQDEINNLFAKVSLRWGICSMVVYVVLQLILFYFFDGSKAAMSAVFTIYSIFIINAFEPLCFHALEVNNKCNIKNHEYEYKSAIMTVKLYGTFLVVIIAGLVYLLFLIFPPLK